MFKPKELPALARRENRITDDEELELWNFLQVKKEEEIFKLSSTVNEIKELLAIKLEVYGNEEGLKYFRLERDGTFYLSYRVVFRMKSGHSLWSLIDQCDVFFGNADEILKLIELMDKSCRQASHEKAVNKHAPLYKAAFETLKEQYLDPCGIEVCETKFFW
jgi:hypothetical protein